MEEMVEMAGIQMEEMAEIPEMAKVLGMEETAEILEMASFQQLRKWCWLQLHA